jgi:hypothetical protein
MWCITAALMVASMIAHAVGQWHLHRPIAAGRVLAVVPAFNESAENLYACVLRRAAPSSALSGRGRCRTAHRRANAAPRVDLAVVVRICPYKSGRILAPQLQDQRTWTRSGPAAPRFARTGTRHWNRDATTHPDNLTKHY